jgi:hypothetical protein
MSYFELFGPPSAEFSAGIIRALAEVDAPKTSAGPCAKLPPKGRAKLPPKGRTQSPAEGRTQSPADEGRTQSSKGVSAEGGAKSSTGGRAKSSTGGRAKSSTGGRAKSSTGGRAELPTGGRAIPSKGMNRRERRQRSRVLWKPDTVPVAPAMKPVGRISVPRAKITMVPFQQPPKKTQGWRPSDLRYVKRYMHPNATATSPSWSSNVQV